MGASTLFRPHDSRHVIRPYFPGFKVVNLEPATLILFSENQIFQFNLILTFVLFRKLRFLYKRN